MDILLVEDDNEISEMLKSFLESEGYRIETAMDGEKAWQKFQNQDFALILLDLMIPKINGMEIMKRIRQSSTIPIIIISAKDTDSDKTLGLGLGADDYITKPFSVTEVVARIKANIRRSTLYTTGNKQDRDVIKSGIITMNLEEYTVQKNEQKIELTAKEFDIMKLLMSNPRKVYTKAQIYALVWNDAYMGDENAVNVHISRLRTKLEDDAKNPIYITTVWGIGYKWGETHE